ncbi:helix-turn-helix domain-containing protein [Bacillus sp. JCM 19034]|uniref:helix-turn-helix domain-containing protein n=1 Tax=Bacillus sp. JCM 19034 TaxID=1481928 RepID=UPI00351D668F
MRKNYKEELKLQDIADRFYLSREYISRRFKQEFNETITDFIISIRMKKAKELLRNQELRIYEVAELLDTQMINTSPNFSKNMRD